MWGIYCLVWRNRVHHGGSRVFLLASLLLPLLLPLIRLPQQHTGILSRVAVPLPEFVTSAGNSTISPADHFSLSAFAIAGYCLGLVLMLAAYAIAYIRLLRKADGDVHYQEGYRIITNTGIGPGTFGCIVFFPAGEVQDAILRHELAHIRLGHRHDNLLVQTLRVLLWFSPVHWLIARELKVVHEFEADQEASREDKEVYAYTLLSEVFGLSAPLSLGHSFFQHPIKRRITMLQHQEPKNRLTQLASRAGSLTALFIACALLVQCKRSDLDKGQSQTSNAPAASVRTATPPAPATVAPQDGIYKFADQMPEFNGDLSTYLIGAIKYPETARKAGKQGRAVLQFVVREDGRIDQVTVVRSAGDASLDAEAKRVVTAMPSWQPGMQDGKKVPVQFTLPISFKLG